MNAIKHYATTFVFLSLCGVSLNAAVLPPVVYVVSPIGYDLAEGNSASASPFNGTGVRFQQVFAASDFQPVGAGWIIGLNFRVDGFGTTFTSTTLPDIQINLSTTLRQPDSLSPVFQDNIGPNDTVVRSGTLTISGSNFHLPGQANSFEVGIPLTTPFFYDPAQGNLLLDVRNFMGAATSPFDAISTAGDSVSSLFSLGANANSGTPSTIGLATLVAINTVPEPSTWSLVIAGLAALGLFHRVRKRKR